MIKRILLVGNAEDENILKCATYEVPIELVKSDEIQNVIDDMIDTLRDAGGLGISANQIGSKWRIFVVSRPEIDPDGESFEIRDRFDTYINPVMVVKSGQACSYAEGCLSVPGKRLPIKRASEVKLRALDREGRVIGYKTKKKKDAFAIQHEMDHLNGVLICDKGDTA